MSEFVSGSEVLPIRDELQIEQELKKLEKEKENMQELACVTNTSSGKDQCAQMLLSPTHSLTTNPEVIADSTMDFELAIASAISSEKTRNKHYNAWLDKYVDANDGNLYPTRGEKERLAEEMSIPYAKVNRFFANRRRKQSKNRQRPIATSPATMNATSGGLQQMVNEQTSTSRVPSPLATKLLGMEASNQPLDYSQAIQAQQEDSNNLVDSSSTSSSSSQSFVPNPDQSSLTDILKKMVALNQSAEYLSLAQNGIAMDPNNLPLNEALAFIQNSIKMVTLQQPSIDMLMSFLASRLQAGASVTETLQSIQSAIYQQQFLQSQFVLTHGLVPNPANVHENQWGGSSISASPMVNSDSEVSDQSELSPSAPQYPLEVLQQYQVDQQYAEERVSSPPFKDPHQIADPEMTMLLDNPQSSSSASTSSGYEKAAPPQPSAFDRLTEREKLAIAALTEFSTVSR